MLFLCTNFIMLRLLSNIILKNMGWKIIGRSEFPDKCIIIAAPHTSNWDFVIGRSFGYMLGIKVKYLAKSQLFKPAFGWFFTYTGGIPVDRTKHNSLVAFTTELFIQSKELVVGIAPEGTRKRVEKWKQGFYHIAIGANVPIVLSFMDYKRKEAGVGKILYPSGDIEKDMSIIEEFYRGVNPKNPEYYNPKIY